MNYSPILAPVLALVIWEQVAWFTGVPILYRAIMADPPLTRVEMLTQVDRLPWNTKVKPLEFYLVCIVLALMGSGRGFACWLAWAFATCWAMQGLSEPASKSKFTRAIKLVATLLVYALILPAAIQITRDLLAAYD